MLSFYRSKPAKCISTIALLCVYLCAIDHRPSVTETCMYKRNRFACYLHVRYRSITFSQSKQLTCIISIALLSIYLCAIPLTSRQPSRFTCIISIAVLSIYLRAIPSHLTSSNITLTHLCRHLMCRCLPHNIKIHDLYHAPLPSLHVPLSPSCTESKSGPVNASKRWPLT